MGGRKAVDLYRVIISVWISIVKCDSHCTPLECWIERIVFLLTLHGAVVRRRTQRSSIGMEDLVSHEELYGVDFYSPPLHWFGVCLRS